MERPVQFANGHNPIASLRRLLSGLKNRIRAHVSAASGLGSLASECYPGRSALVDAAAHLVARPGGRVSRPLGGATPEFRSAADDFVLVHQQLVRSTDRRRFDALSRRRTDSLHKRFETQGFFVFAWYSIGPFLSSFLDAAFVVWNHWGQGSYWELIRIRLFSNALAALIVVPLVVTWATNGLQTLREARISRYLEGCALFLGLLRGQLRRPL